MKTSNNLKNKLIKHIDLIKRLNDESVILKDENNKLKKIIKNLKKNDEIHNHPLILKNQTNNTDNNNVSLRANKDNNLLSNNRNNHLNGYTNRNNQLNKYTNRNNQPNDNNNRNNQPNVSNNYNSNNAQTVFRKYLKKSNGEKRYIDYLVSRLLESNDEYVHPNDKMNDLINSIVILVK